MNSKWLKRTTSLSVFGQDTKVVMVLSNDYYPTEKGSVKRRKQECNQIEVVVPTHLSDNQKHMKGVDLLDQMIGNDRFVYP